jgi:hypothetical protein
MKKRLILAFASVFIIGCIYGIYSWWHGQSTTSAISYGAAPSGVVLGAQTSLINWQTPYFITRYPSSLRKISTAQTPDNPVMASYVFTGTGSEDSDQLAITIGSLNGSPLSDISAIQLRKDEASEYTQSSRSFAPSGAVVFDEIGNYETSIFWQHGDQYAAVVTSGLVSDSTDLEQDLSDVVSNWQWQ